MSTVSTVSIVSTVSTVSTVIARCYLHLRWYFFQYLMFQVFLLCTKLQGHCQVWDVPTGFEVNCPHISRIAIEYVRARYIGYTANVTFNEGVQENRTGKRTSSRALSFLKQVYSYYAEWYFTVCPPAEPKRSRCPVQPLQRGLPHVWILNIALSCSCIAIKIGFENPWKSGLQLDASGYDQKFCKTFSTTIEPALPRNVPNGEGGVIFNPKIYVADFGDFKQGFLSMKLVQKE